MFRYTKITLFFCFLLFLVNSLQAQNTAKATLLDHKDRIRIVPVAAVNSPYRETNVNISPDGKYLFFMSMRGGKVWSSPNVMYGGVQNFDGDIWYSKKINGEWQPANCMPMGINTFSGEDEPNISPDGHTVTFQSWRQVVQQAGILRYLYPIWQKDGGPYYTAKFNGKDWESPVGLGSNITQFFIKTQYNATDGMAMSPNGKTFIVAAGPSYDSRMDLYISHKEGYVWSYPERLNISTGGDERSVFIAPDGKTIFFSSNGYGGFGGMDIFKVEMKPDGTFGEIMNIGEPFNTAGDDLGFILTGDGKEAYFSRDGDIYYADLTEADERIKPQILIYLSGVITDRNTLTGIPASVTIRNKKDNKQIKVKADEQGRYEAYLPNVTEEYEILINAKLYNTVNSEVSTQEEPYAHSYEANFVLEKPQVVVKEEPKKKEEVIVLKDEPKKEEVVVKKEEVVVKEEPKKEEIMEREEEKKVEKKEPEDPYSFEGVAENHLILLLDISGSMQYRDRLPLLKTSLLKLIQHMRAEDRVTVLAYASSVVVLGENISTKDTAKVKAVLQRLGSGGGTDSKNALKRAYEIGKEHFVEGGNNRIILATDGDFNVGELYTLAQKLAKENMFLSVFCFGKPNKDTDEKLNKLSQKGNGNYQIINIDNIDDALLEEVKAVRN